jgi:hypothetical protein
MSGKEKPEGPREPARRQVDEVFGELLPGTTSDERDPESSIVDIDSWYLENRPPHHER